MNCFSRLKNKALRKIVIFFSLVALLSEIGLPLNFAFAEGIQSKTPAPQTDVSLCQLFLTIVFVDGTLALGKKLGNWTLPKLKNRQPVKILDGYFPEPSLEHPRSWLGRKMQYIPIATSKKIIKKPLEFAPLR